MDVTLEFRKPSRRIMEYVQELYKMKSLHCYPNWIQSVDNIKNSLSMLHWISLAIMQHNYRKSLSSHNLQYPHQEYSYLLSIFYHISAYQISLHISDAIRGCMIPCELHHLPCLWFSYQCKLLSHYCRMREVPSTSLPNSVTSGLIIDPLLS